MELMLNSIVKISKNSASKTGGCGCSGDNSIKKLIHKNGVRPYNMQAALQNDDSKIMTFSRSIQSQENSQSFVSTDRSNSVIKAHKQK